jgi:hypothetical protein
MKSGKRGIGKGQIKELSISRVAVAGIPPLEVRGGEGELS